MAKFTAADANDLYREHSRRSGDQLVVRDIARSVKWADWTDVAAAFEQLKASQPQRVALRENGRGLMTVAIG